MVEFVSKLMNCTIIAREEDKNKNLFYGKIDGEILCSLDGYAIIPIEHYRKLISIEEEDR